MNMRAIPFLLLLLPAAFAGCSAFEAFNESCTASGEVVGSTAVDLDVRRNTVRSRQAAVGDLVADAMLEAAAGSGAVASLQNAGAIRAERCTGGERESIPAGPVTEADIEDLLPFENYVAVVTLDGAQLKSVLERAVSALPEDNQGWFLQVSGIGFTADCGRQRQVLSADATQIVTEGDRVADITVAGLAWSSSASYTVVTSDFVARGEDGFVAMQGAASQETALLYTDALKAHLAAHSPVAPSGTGRIDLVGCSLP